MISLLRSNPTNQTQYFKIYKSQNIKFLTIIQLILILVLDKITGYRGSRIQNLVYKFF